MRLVGWSPHDHSPESDALAVEAAGLRDRSGDGDVADRTFRKSVRKEVADGGRQALCGGSFRYPT